MTKEICNPNHHNLHVTHQSVCPDCGGTNLVDAYRPDTPSGSVQERAKDITASEIDALRYLLNWYNESPRKQLGSILDTHNLDGVKTSQQLEDLYAKLKHSLAGHAGASSMQGEVEELRAWKESAMKILGLGHDISVNILPVIKDLKAENERLRSENSRMLELLDWLKDVTTDNKASLRISDYLTGVNK
jgi:hypothetical protein